MAKLMASQADLRDALAWTLDHELELGLALAGGLSRFWLVHGDLDEGRSWLEKALSLGSGPPELRAKALWGTALLACLLGDFVAVEPAIDEGLCLASQARDMRIVARLLNVRGVCRVFTDPSGAVEVLGEASALARQADETYTLVSSLGMLGFARILSGDLCAAREALEECVGIGGGLGESQPLVIGLVGLGHVALHQGDPARARRLLEQGLAVGARVGDPLWVGLALAFLAEVEAARGDHSRARELAGEAVGVAREANSIPVTGLCLAVAGQVELGACEPSKALPYFEEAISLCGTGERSGVRNRALVGIGRTRMHLGQADPAQLALEQAVNVAEEGKHGIAIANGLYWLGRFAHLSRGDREWALRLHLEALALQRRTHHNAAIPASLEAIAELAAENQEATRAARLLGAADSLRRSMDLPRTREEQAAYKVASGSVEKMLDCAERVAAWSAGSRLGAEGAVAYACRGRGPRRQQRSGWTSLTPAERQVVELAGEYLTNREIGTCLFMSPRTVGTHLLHVYRKLDLNSRRELAREIARRRHLNKDLGLEL